MIAKENYIAVFPFKSLPLPSALLRCVYLFRVSPHNL